MIRLITKKLFRNKANMILIVIFTLCSFALVGGFLFGSNYIKMYSEDLEKNIYGRTIMIVPKESIRDDYLINGKEYKYDFNSILKIKHVQAAYNANVDTSGYTSLKDDEYNGFVGLRYGNESVLTRVIEGSKFSSDDTGVVICPYNFYPDSKDITLETKYYDKDKLLNTSFEFPYKECSIDRKCVDKTKTFKIVGLYDSDLINESHFMCFAPAKYLQEIYDNSLAILNKGSIGSADVIVDNIYNVSYVKDELSKLGYQYTDKVGLDAKFIFNLKLISYTSLAFVLIVMVFVTVTYVKKRNVMNSKEIGLYSSLGFSSRHIQIIYTTDILIISTISNLIAMCLSLIAYQVILNYFENYFINVMYQPKLFISSYVIAFLTVYFISLLINFIFIKKSLKKSENYLMKEVE